MSPGAHTGACEAGRGPLALQSTVPGCIQAYDFPGSACSNAAAKDAVGAVLRVCARISRDVITTCWNRTLSVYRFAARSKVTDLQL